MNTSDIWSIAAAILTSLGGGIAIVFSFSSWLGRVWASKIIAKHKIELDMALHKHNVVASRIDAQRVDAIRDLYGALIGWHEAASEIVAPNEFLSKSSGTEPYYLAKYATWAKDLRARSMRLEDRAMRTAIYFSEDTYRLIARCGLTASEMSIDFCAAALKDQAPGSRAHLDRVEAARNTLSQRYSAEFGPAREAIVKTFRKIVDPTT